jgi:uncharacterized protein
MAIRQQIDDDIKAAMLAGDSLRVDTLRGLKSVVLYADVAAKKRETGGISDEEILSLLAKEAKKRQESADLYVTGGSQERADKEMTEKALIESYLPVQLDDDEIRAIIHQVVIEQDAKDLQAMGKVISAVKSKVGSTADGARIAQLVKERLIV